MPAGSPEDPLRARGQVGRGRGEHGAGCEVVSVGHAAARYRAAGLTDRSSRMPMNESSAEREFLITIRRGVGPLRRQLAIDIADAIRRDASDHSPACLRPVTWPRSSACRAASSPTPTRSSPHRASSTRGRGCHRSWPAGAAPRPTLPASPAARAALRLHPDDARCDAVPAARMAARAASAPSGRIPTPSWTTATASAASRCARRLQSDLAGVRGVVRTRAPGRRARASRRARRGLRAARRARQAAPCDRGPRPQRRRSRPPARPAWRSSPSRSTPTASTSRARAGRSRRRARDARPPVPDRRRRSRRNAAAHCCSGRARATRS